MGFLARLRHTDLASLRTRWGSAVACTAGLLALGWVAAADHLAESGRTARQRARIETAARGAGLALDGDLLADPTADLVSLSEVATAFARAMELQQPLEIVRVDAALRASVRSAGATADGALPVVAQGSPEGPAAGGRTHDLVPAIAGIVTSDRTLWTTDRGGRLVTWAVVPDSFGEVAGLVRLETRAGGTPLEHALTILLHGLAAGLVAWLVTRTARRAIGRHCDRLEELAGAEALVGVENALAPEHYPRSEMRHLADTVRRLAGLDVPQEERHEDAEHGPAAGASRRAVRSLGKLARVAARAAAPIAGRQTTTSEPVVAPLPTQKFDDHQEFTPRDLVESTVAGYRNRVASRGVELKVFVGERVPQRIAGPSSAISMVLEALVSNACKQTRQGSVRVRATRELQAEPRMRFEVTDTGSGIPPHLQPVVHERIASCVDKPFQDAMGGLAQAGHILAQIDGRLEFESQPGHGSRFWFTVPFAAEGAEVQAA